MKEKRVTGEWGPDGRDMGEETRETGRDIDLTGWAQHAERG